MGHPSRDAEQVAGHTGLEARGLTVGGCKMPRGAERAETGVGEGGEAASEGRAEPGAPVLRPRECSVLREGRQGASAAERSGEVCVREDIYCKDRLG